MIHSALISVFDKEGLDKLVPALHRHGVLIYSTGGTAEFIRNLGVPVIEVESVTGYPGIFGGRVKTLHPVVFGGILYRRENEEDIAEKEKYQIPSIDLVVVDLYPFEKTVASTNIKEQIIEKIDIGGVSLIRAAAKNHHYTSVISDRTQYDEFIEHLNSNAGNVSAEFRVKLAASAFVRTSAYDQSIADYFNEVKTHELRYGENPHQEATFKSNVTNLFEQLHGKELSYNNLLDMDAAIGLMADLNHFKRPACAIIKHNNACGASVRTELSDAFRDALAGDPVSAFGGVIVCNRTIDALSAESINEIFFEILIAPGFDDGAMEILKSKKNRILILLKHFNLPEKMERTVLNGTLAQHRDHKLVSARDGQIATKTGPGEALMEDLDFANILVKHTKSNAIVLARNLQLIGSGTGQTSRVDALKHAIQKCAQFDFNTHGSVMASDAFFPFPDCVEIAYHAGIVSVIQPGGSIKDQSSIDYCDEHGMSMIFTGTRHFKH